MHRLPSLILLVWVCLPVCLVAAPGCGRSHSSGDPPCDDTHPPGAPCEGTWTCSPTSIEGSTGTHFSERSCAEGVVRERTWTEPFAPGPEPPAIADAGLEPPGVEDAGPEPGIDDAGPGACRVAGDEIVATEPTGCSRPGLAVDGDEVRIAWSAFLYRGRLARRVGGVWGEPEDAFGADVRRVDLDGPGAVVERNGGAVELWDVSEGEPRAIAPLEGIHTAARGRSLAVSDVGVHHVLSVHTHEDDGFTWSVHHTSGGAGAVRTDELADERSVAAYGLELDGAGAPSMLYSVGADLFHRRSGVAERVPLSDGVSVHAYDVSVPRFATLPRGVTHVLGRRASDAGWGPSGAAYETLLLSRAADGEWTTTVIARDEPDGCPDTPSVGAVCPVDRTWFGPSAALVRTARGARVLLASHHTRGELVFRCDDEGLRDIPCFWDGELETDTGLRTGLVHDGAVELEDVVGSATGSDPRMAVVPVGGDVHVAVTETLTGVDGPSCRVRHVRLACD